MSFAPACLCLRDFLPAFRMSLLHSHRFQSEQAHTVPLAVRQMLLEKEELLRAKDAALLTLEQRLHAVQTDFAVLQMVGNSICSFACCGLSVVLLFM